MSQRSETYAYLWIEGFLCDPSEITALMQLEPFETRKAGDLIQDRFERTGQKHFWPKNSWKFRSSLPLDGTFQQSHIQNILDIIELRSEVLRDLQMTCDIGINCVGYYWNANPGLHLSTDLIRRCASLNLSIDFDLYNFPEDNEDAQQAAPRNR